MPVLEAMGLYALKAIGSFGFDYAQGKALELAKKKALETYDDYFGELVKLDKESLGGELQKAAHKAQLSATVFACHACLAELTVESNKTEIKWLTELIKSFQEKIATVSAINFQTTIADQDGLDMFNRENSAELIKKLHEATFELIQTDGPSFSDFSENGFKLLKHKIEEGWEESARPDLPARRIDWFDLVCRYFNQEYTSNKNLTETIQKLKNKDIIEKLNSLVGHLPKIDEIFELAQSMSEDVKGIKEGVKKLLDQGGSGPVIQGVNVVNLPSLNVKVYGRDNEKALVLEALRGETEESKTQKFALVVAPSAFGKTFLLTKALQHVTDGKAIKPEYSEILKSILLIDCRLTKSVSQIVSAFNILLGAQMYFEEGADVKEWCNTNLFPLSNQSGPTWIIFDNFETWLDGENDYKIADPRILGFLNTLLESNHSLRGIFLSQSEPGGEIKSKLNTLDSIGKELYKGLPKADALNYLRTEGAKVGLDKAPEKLLEDFLERISYIPQAMSSLIGYLTNRSDYDFSDFMGDRSFWDEFDADEQNEKDLENGIRRTKALIARQIKSQSPGVKRLLQALTFFGMPTPREALELLFESTAASANPVSRLHSHNLATVTVGPRGTRYYSLHNYFREQASKVLDPIETIATQGFANRLGNKSGADYERKYYIRSGALIELVIKIYQYLLDRGQANLEPHLAMGFMGKSDVIYRLGRLNESVAESEKAIQIYERLIRKAKWKELAIQLAMAYTIKGVSLMDLGKLKEATREFNKSTGIYERLLAKGKRDEVAWALGLVYINKGRVFFRSDLFDRSIAEYDKTIRIYERLIKQEKWKYLENPLAWAYMNKGNALKRLGRFNEALVEYDKAILIRMRLIEEEKRDEVRDDLAMVYMNRAAVLGYLKRSNEAIADYDNAIRVYEHLLVEEKRDDVAKDLAQTYINKGFFLFELNGTNEGLKIVEKAIALYERLVKDQNRDDLAGELALAYEYKDFILRQSNR